MLVTAHVTHEMAGLVRICAIGICVGGLIGLFILGGIGYPSAPSPGLDLADPATDPTDHAGEYVQTGGTVGGTDPVVIEIEGPAGIQRLPVEDAPHVEMGQDVVVDGVLTERGTLRARAERAVVRAPWETTYMYAVSVLAALVVALRGIDGWTVDGKTKTIVPREPTLHEQYLSRASQPARRSDDA